MKVLSKVLDSDTGKMFESTLFDDDNYFIYIQLLYILKMAKISHATNQNKTG